MQKREIGSFCTAHEKASNDEDEMHCKKKKKNHAFRVVNFTPLDDSLVIFFKVRATVNLFLLISSLFSVDFFY